MLDGMEANRLSARTGIKSIKKIKKYFGKSRHNNNQLITGAHDKSH